MFIDVGEEVEKTVYDFPVEMDDQMMDFMFEVARNEISEDEFTQMMVEWAMVHIITEKVKEFTESLNTEDQEDK